MFYDHIKEFNNNINALRDFVELINSLIENEQDESFNKIAPLLLSGIISNYKKEKLEEIDEEANREITHYEQELNTTIQSIYGESVDISVEKTGGDNETITISFDTSHNSKIKKDIGIYNKRKYHNKLLLRTSLISLISTIEWMFSQIIHYYYDKYPEAAGILNQNLTLSQLKTFNNFKDAEKYLIDLKIESILRGNFESWIKILKEEFKLGLGYLDKNYDDIIEIFQRRNLYVHNGGIVNSIYISKVNKQKNTEIKVGDMLEIDKEYLEKSIDLLQLLFTLIAAELWKKMEPDDEKRGDILTDIIYDNLLFAKWEISEGLSFFVIKDTKQNSTSRTISQLNYWLCKKRTNKYNEIKNEIENVDFSDKKELYQLALYALREMKKEFFELLPSILDSDQLNVEQLEEFPIFSDMRNIPEYQRFKDGTLYFKKPNKEID